MSYRISEKLLQTRKKNILWGAVLSLMLVGVIVAGHLQYPTTYNDVLLWSVAFFVVFGNLINYYRYRRYLRLIKDHRIDVDGDRVHFYTGGEKSVLEIKDIAVLTFYRRRGKVKHIQLKLRNNRGIRLESYADLEQLGRVIADRMPKEHVVGNSD